MESLLYSFFAGISTSLGVVFLCVFGKPSEKVLATLLGFAGGIMLAISVFELLPKSVDFGSMINSLIGFGLGSVTMYILDKVLPHFHMSDSDDLVVENPENMGSVKNPILRTGYLVLFGIALHNVPEGLAIGAGIEASPDLGLFIAIAIALHNIPEGLAMAAPLKAGGLSSIRIFLFTIGAGLMTPLGTGIGLIFFRISPVFIGGSLAFAAGAMIYIVNDELIPQAKSMNNHLSIGGLIFGLILGFILL